MARDLIDLLRARSERHRVRLAFLEHLMGLDSVSAEEYAKRFAAAARERREWNRDRFRCADCGATGPELMEYDGKLRCASCRGPRLLSSGAEEA